MDHNPPTAGPPVRHQIGMHVIEIEGDVVVTRIIGDFKLSDMQEFYVLAKQLSEQHPLYSIGDMTRAGTIAADARRYAVEHGQGLRIVCSALFGINPAMRVLLIMLTRAAKLMKRSDNEAVLEFAKNETAARAFVAALRAQRESAPTSVSSPKKS